MDVIKVKHLVSIGDSEQGCLSVSGEGIGHIGRITFSIPPKLQGFNLNVNDVLPSPTRPAPPMPTCKPPKSHTKMLEKLLDFAHKGAISNEAIGADFYTKGKQVAYEEMWEHIARILRKECDNE